MTTSNTTEITEFILLGFPGLDPKYEGLVAAVLFFLFLVIVGGNLFILVFVYCEEILHKSTYFIFCHLAANDLLFGTVTLPRVISRYWLDDRRMPFGACFAQMYFVHSLGAIHSLLLLIMALDRFIAICVPMHYPVLITTTTVTTACSVSWAFTFVRMSGVVAHALSLSYCGSNGIKQCYCDHVAITNLGCGRDAVIFVKTVAVGNALFSLLVPLTFITFSYIAIILVAVVKLASSKGGRFKSLSTCTPQILSTLLYYLPRCFVYISNYLGVSLGADLRISLVLVYSLLPAAINPVIYCLKTKDIKVQIIKKFQRMKVGLDIKQTLK